MPPRLPFGPDVLSALVAAFAGLSLVLFLGLLVAVRRARRLREELEDETYHRQSLSTTYGRITEQWFPLMDAYPYDPQGFRFLGSPVDGIQFEEDRVVIVEFKTNRSRLSENQKRIKRLVEEGHVYWEEFHFTDDD